MDIKALAQQYESYIIERRRYYHSYPELSKQEVQTLASIKKDLEAMGITDFTMMKGCNGMLARIHGAKPGKTVALRTDIDALPITENTGLEFASKNPGVMHACGHDCHIAMLLGAAKILMDCKDELEGDVVLLIQPSEENAGGAKMMLAENCLEGIDAVYGAHIWGDFDAPYISVESGNRMSAFSTFKIIVNGIAAHGSAPNKGIDAIAVSAAIINNLQQIVSRKNDPLNPLVVSVCTINGGTQNNILCNKVEMTGTCRTYLGGTYVEDMMRKIIEDTAKTFNTTATLEDFFYGTVPLINDKEDLVAIGQNAVRKLYGDEALGHLAPMMASEDFSWLANEVPGLFAFIGSRNKEKGLVYTNHHEKYDVDESVLQRGSGVMAQFAADYLASQK